MAEFDVLKEYARMVKPDKCGNCTIDCMDCPISIDNNGTNELCTDFMRLYPEKATEIIRKWSEEHPQKTRADLLLEHFPDARLIEIRPCNIFGSEWTDENCIRFESCRKCMSVTWDEVVE